jgi:hypothetical protein
MAPLHRFVTANATNGSNAPRAGGRYARVTRYDGGWDISIAIGDAGSPQARAVAELTIDGALELAAVLEQVAIEAMAARQEWNAAA